MKIIEVCAALIFAGDEVLLTSRPGHQEHPGYWEFPGGKIEYGETPAQCIKRELKEELNIDVTVFDTVYMFEYEYPDKQVVLRFMRCMIKDNQKPQALEKQEYAWVKRGMLNNYQLLPADECIVKFLTIF